MLSQVFKLVLYYPLLNLLLFFYHYIPDLGVVIVLLTVLIRLLLLPSFHKSLKHQKLMSELQPKLNEVKEKYKNDKQQQAKALMELYQEHKINPLGSCLPLLIQLPVLITLYQVFIRSLNGQALEGVYSFVPKPEHINPLFLGVINLAHRNVYLAILAGGLQYFQSRLMLPKLSTQDATTKMMSYQTLYILPAITFIFGLTLPSALPLFWVVTTLFGIAQQYYILRKEAQAALGK